MSAPHKGNFSVSRPVRHTALLHHEPQRGQVGIMILHRHQNSVLSEPKEIFREVGMYTSDRGWKQLAYIGNYDQKHFDVDSAT